MISEKLRTLIFFLNITHYVHFQQVPTIIYSQLIPAFWEAPYFFFFFSLFIYISIY